MREDGCMTKVDRALALGNAQIAIANQSNPELLATGVRTSLQWFSEQNPGRAVEVRVPPYLAVQIIGGTTHRRGTPPAVVEMSPQTWLELFTQELTWENAISAGKIFASGERSDLSGLF